MQRLIPLIFSLSLLVMSGTLLLMRDTSVALRLVLTQDDNGLFVRTLSDPAPVARVDLGTDGGRAVQFIGWQASNLIFTRFATVRDEDVLHVHALTGAVRSVYDAPRGDPNGPDYLSSHDGALWFVSSIGVPNGVEIVDVRTGETHNPPPARATAAGRVSSRVRRIGDGFAYLTAGRTQHEARIVMADARGHVVSDEVPENASVMVAFPPWLYVEVPDETQPQASLYQLMRVHMETGAVQALARPAQQVYPLFNSAQGQTLLYYAADDTVYRIDPTRFELTPLLTGVRMPFHVDEPAEAYVYAIANTGDLLRTPLDGTSADATVVARDVDEFDAGHNPMRALLVARSRSGHVQPWTYTVMQLDGSNPQQLSLDDLPQRPATGSSGHTVLTPYGLLQDGQLRVVDSDWYYSPDFTEAITYTPDTATLDVYDAVTLEVKRQLPVPDGLHVQARTVNWLGHGIRLSANQPAPASTGGAALEPAHFYIVDAVTGDWRREVRNTRLLSADPHVSAPTEAAGLGPWVGLLAVGVGAVGVRAVRRRVGGRGNR